VSGGLEPVSMIWRSEKFFTLLGLKIQPVIMLVPLDFAVSKLNLLFFEL
jgi:hypothetical protein